MTLPNNWNELLEKTGLNLNEERKKEFENYCEEFEFSDKERDEIIKEEKLNFFWQEYITEIKLGG